MNNTIPDLFNLPLNKDQIELLNKPIENKEFPPATALEKEYKVKYCYNDYKNEKLVPLSDHFEIASSYYAQGIVGAIKECYCRESVYNKLIEAEKLLPEGFKFLIFDAYRPIEVQESLWNNFRSIIKESKKDEYKNEKDLDTITEHFVAKPSYDILYPSVHNTGGCIDLTLTYKGQLLDMGTKFDYIGPMAYSNYFENTLNMIVLPKENNSETIKLNSRASSKLKNINQNNNKRLNGSIKSNKEDNNFLNKDGYNKNLVENNNFFKIRYNRRLLCNAMLKVGFTNVSTEWWHYDFGTKFWAYYKNKEFSLYPGIL